MPNKPYESSQLKANVVLAKFYLAAQLAGREKAAGVIAILQEAGLTCTYDWTAHGSVKDDGHERMAAVAIAEVNGVADADFFVLLAPGGRGAHVELGIAIALDLPALVVYETENDMTVPYPSVFHHHPGVTRLHIAKVSENVGAHLTHIANQILEWRNNFHKSEGG